jgi:hypothetical protein
MNPLTGVLGEAWGFYRRFAAHFLTIAFVLYLVTAVIVAVLTVSAGATGYFLAAVIEFVAAFLVQAAMVKAVQDVRDGQADLSVGGTISAAAPFVLPVAGASLLAAIGIGIGLVVLIVPGLILLTYSSLIVPTIVVGESGALSSFGKSWRAISGHFWQAFGTYVLVFLIWIAFNIVLGLALLAVPAAVRSFVSSVIAGTLLAPLYALVVTLVYYRLSESHAGAMPASPPHGGFTAPPAQALPVCRRPDEDATPPGLRLHTGDGAGTAASPPSGPATTPAISTARPARG